MSDHSTVVRGPNNIANVKILARQKGEEIAKNSIGKWVYPGGFLSEMLLNYFLDLLMHSSIRTDQSPTK